MGLSRRNAAGVGDDDGPGEGGGGIGWPSTNRDSPTERLRVELGRPRNGKCPTGSRLTLMSSPPAQCPYEKDGVRCTLELKAKGRCRFHQRGDLPALGAEDAS